MAFICEKLFPVLFADDTNMFHTDKNLAILIEDVNIELEMLVTWLKANKLSLNINKTHYMKFSNSIDSLPDPIHIDGKDL